MPLSTITVSKAFYFSHNLVIFVIRLNEKGQKFQFSIPQFNTLQTEEFLKYTK